jgi:hypothetical protein
MKVALVLSLVANALLAALLLFSRVNDKPAAAKPVAYCETLKKDIDFFIEGLSKGNDPFFTPLVVRSLGSLLPSCFPDNATMIDATMAELRTNLMHLVAANATAEQKRQSHDNALRIFRELRQLFGSST